RLLARGWFYAIRRAVGQQFPTLFIVLEVRHHDLIEHLLVHGRIEDWAQYLHTAVEIARHHVSGGDVDRRLGVRQSVSGTEAVDPAVLEKTTDDRFDADVLRQRRQAGPQAANTAHHEVDGNAGPRRFIE